jgi:uncharacterized Zn-binding protein involved in type VI secretion
MSKAHRDGDSRSCGATTVVQNQSTVFVNGKLWAVKGSVNSHGSGGLINSGSTVTINGIPVIVHAPDNAQPDNLCPPLGGEHCDPKTAEGSDNVFCY